MRTIGVLSVLLCLAACGGDRAGSAAANDPAASVTTAENAQSNAATQRAGGEEGPSSAPPRAEAAPPSQPGATALTANVGEAAPPFELVDESGTTRRLADYRGKIVVLEWTNPTCPFVVRHYGDDRQTMKRLDASLPDDRVVWLAIDSTAGRTAQEAVAWKQDRGVGYPVLLDASGTVGRAYGARTTPHMFVIDTDGVLRYAGAIDDDPRGSNGTPRNLVQDAVQALLEGRAPAVTQTEPYGCSVHYAS